MVAPVRKRMGSIIRTCIHRPFLEGKKDKKKKLDTWVADATPQLVASSPPTPRPAEKAGGAVVEWTLDRA